MDNLYGTNGLMFWTEEEIKNRKMVEDFFVRSLTHTLKVENKGFEFFQVEAPILTPAKFINSNYEFRDMFTTADNLILRPETTMGSYVAAKELLSSYHDRKVKLPICLLYTSPSPRDH
jgi:hypothetical protein